MKRRTFGAVRSISSTRVLAVIDDGEHRHVTSFPSKPEVLAYLASLGYCVPVDGVFKQLP
jgi:hypothetical protein